MQDESRLGRLLWIGTLSVVVVLVIASFARRPLFGGEGEASGFSGPLTLWVTGSEEGGQAETVAKQLAGCWQEDGRSVTVGVLPGGSSSAVLEFLDRVHDTPDELLLITDTTLSDIARDEADPLLSEPRERAQRALRLLTAAAPLMVFDGDRLALATRASSNAQTATELPLLMRKQPSRPLFGLAADSWLEGNLAALVQAAGLQGEMPYNLFTTSHSAMLGLRAGQVQAVLAPAGAISPELRRGGLRELPWPTADGRAGEAPHTWVAVMAPTGLSRSAIAALGAQTRGDCTGAAWSELLRTDNLSPLRPSAGSSSFIGERASEAERLQTLAARVMRAY